MLHARALRYLDEVARRGSIRAAAGRLNVSSSAINRQILELENSLGAQIFHRLPKRLRLTPIGELLIAHVRQTLKDFERVQLRVDDMKSARTGDVTIATDLGVLNRARRPVGGSARHRRASPQGTSIRC